MIKNLFIKYKSLISYVVFGVLTTIVNIVVYNLCYYPLSISNIASTVIAWIVSVLFAYITNKLFVFDSKSFEAKVLIHEIPTFFGCRLATGILDVIIMYVAVDVMHLTPMVWKIISNILVIIINYVASKLVIFNKKK